MIAWLRTFFEDLSLRKTIAMALIAGLAVPVGISAWVHLRERRANLLERLNADHAQIVEVLVSGMQTPLWEIRPDAGRALLKALMVDQRITSITVFSPVMPQFLAAEAPERRRGRARLLEQPVMRGGEEIGRVRVEMDTGQLESQLAQQWAQTLLIGLLQFVIGMIVIFALLRYKVINPLQRLSTQSETLAEGALDRSLDWRRGDELGALGRSFEKMRRSLRDLFADLAKRNHDLQDREAELASQASVLRATLDNMTDGIMLVDENLHLVAWNDRVIEILGMPKPLFEGGISLEEFIRFDLAGTEHAPVDRETILKSLCNTDHSGCESNVSYRTAAGRWIEIRRRPMPGGGVVNTYTDITERKEAEAELARHREALYQSEKLTALGSLLAGVAHELNNPLSVVVGRSIILEEQLADSDAAKSLAKIRAAAERCTRIVKTFLAMARQQAPVRAPVRIVDVITASLEMVCYGLRTTGIEVSLDLDSDLPELDADPHQLTQVFTNLFINSQYVLATMPEPRQLSVSARFDEAAKALRVRVSDNGPGIPAEIRSRIFEPFFTTKPIGEGTGVGLSVSHAIIQSHGGTISVTVPAGGGTIFEILLPVARAENKDNVATTSAARQPSERHILVVDDEPEVTHMLSDLLAAEGHTVEIAEGGRTALRRLREHDFDLILSDLRMPDLDGPGLYAALESLKPELRKRVIFITGDTLSNTAKRFLTQAGRPVIEKPFIPEDIRRIVGQTLAGFRV